MRPDVDFAMPNNVIEARMVDPPVAIDKQFAAMGILQHGQPIKMAGRVEKDILLPDQVH